MNKKICPNCNKHTMRPIKATHDCNLRCTNCMLVSKYSENMKTWFYSEMMFGKYQINWFPKETCECRWGEYEWTSYRQVAWNGRIGKTAIWHSLLNSMPKGIVINWFHGNGSHMFNSMRKNSSQPQEKKEKIRLPYRFGWTVEKIERYIQLR